MPVTVSEDANALVILTIRDPYTFEEWQAAITPFVTASKPLRILVDRRLASAPPRTMVERMVNCLAVNARAAKDWRVAVVAGTDATYGVARMIELIVEA